MEDGNESIDYIIKERDQFILKSLTSFTEYKKPHPVPIQGETFQNKITVVAEKVNKLLGKRLYAGNCSCISEHSCMSLQNITFTTVNKTKLFNLKLGVQDVFQTMTFWT